MAPLEKWMAITPSAEALKVWVRNDSDAESCLMCFSCAALLASNAFSASVQCTGRGDCEEEVSVKFTMV